MFNPDRKELYGWDPKVPFKHVNSGADRAVEKVLMTMIDYLLHRLSKVSVSLTDVAFIKNDTDLIGLLRNFHSILQEVLPYVLLNEVRAFPVMCKLMCLI